MYTLNWLRILPDSKRFLCVQWSFFERRWSLAKEPIVRSSAVSQVIQKFGKRRGRCLLMRLPAIGIATCTIFKPAYNPVFDHACFGSEGKECGCHNKKAPLYICRHSLVDGWMAWSYVVGIRKDQIAKYPLSFGLAYALMSAGRHILIITSGR
jgi:hypothetical protein